ncbi:MAG: nucleotidyltransferase domain-containing protein [bacterium]|nr:nucleotidyltransferase domain-containing protein [bacterium]
MNLEEYKKNKIKGRKILHNKILETFKSLKPVSIHQFGSGVNGYRDEFSDLDIWITFDDDVVDEIVNKRDEIYSKIAPILIKNENPENSPFGGKYSLVIFDTEYGLYHVDFYLSKKSQTNIRPESIFHYGFDELPRGEWILDKEAKLEENADFTLDFLICMLFIGIKMVVRKNKEFLDFLFNTYKQAKLKYFHNMKDIENNYDIKTLINMINELSTQANPKQKHAIEKIRDECIKIKQILY